MTYPSGTEAFYNFNSFSLTKFTSGTDRSPHCTPLFSMLLTSDQRKNYTSRQPPTSTTRRHHLLSSRTYRSSAIPPLLHPLPTPLSLKFCDRHSSVRTQTRNLSTSFFYHTLSSKASILDTRARAFKRIRAVFRLYSGCIQAVFRLYSGCIQALFRLYSGCIQALFRRMPGEC